MRRDGVIVAPGYPAWSENPGTLAVVCKHCCPLVMPGDLALPNFESLSVHDTLEEAEAAATDHWLTHHFVKSLDWPHIVKEVRSRQDNVEDLIGTED